MNKRIKELMGKTLDDKFSHTWTTMTYEDLEKFSEKFAELIVKDCAEQALKKGMASPDTDFRTGSFLISEYLLGRYGVEE